MQDSTKPGKDKPAEYDGERDMDRFWQVAKLHREPVKQKWFIPILLLLIVISIPWYRAGGEIGSVVLGLPTWIWMSLLCSLGVSILIAVGAMRFWVNDPDDED